MRTTSYLFTLTLLVLAGCATEPTTVTTTTTTQEVTTTGPAREVPGIRLDNRLLAMDRNDLRVGPGNLGSPPTAKRSLGRRPLGTSLQRLGMDSRALAIAARRSDYW